MRATPRLLIAGLSGDAGKTAVTLSLLGALRKRGMTIAPFKKGPDYIDAAWLGWAADTVCRNLDTYMVPSEIVRARFVQASSRAQLALIEGNRGLFDGQDTDGTHSSAALSRLLAAPVVLVLNATKATRTLAALVKGCMDFEAGVTVAGVILNRVAGSRHETIIRSTIEKHCGLPVLGALPKLGSDSALLPHRHLGLVPPTESNECDEIKDRLISLAEHHLDLDALVSIAGRVDPLPASAIASDVRPETESATIGVFRDSVFTFYYPENLEALEAAGAKLVTIDSLTDARLPEIDGLYIGGGFPETQLEALVQNDRLMQSVRAAAEAGLPIYAECGGLIYLAKTLHWGDRSHEMAGVFDIDVSMHRKPCGHGYAVMTVDADNPFFEIGAELRGHEFHYTGVTQSAEEATTCLTVGTGVGVGDGRDGLVYRNCFASYMHVHADGVPSWAPGVVRAAARYRQRRLAASATDEENASESEPAIGRNAKENRYAAGPRLARTL
ncbi:cobyrinate a,c-diamide synthase [candidate division GN15 bacterium]|nr:cobyrinate a,c-diamide synthase [candidate division GN15 bacterium]